MLTPSQLDTWKVRLNQSQMLQKSKWEEWKEAESLVEGTWFKKRGMWEDPDATAVNYATAYHKTLVASSYARNPYIFFEARHKRYGRFAESLERLINYFWAELNLKRQIKRCVGGTSIHGISYIETGFHSTFDTFDLSQPNTDSLLKRLFSPKTASEQGVLNEYIREQMVYAVHLPAWRVYLAPGYHDISTMPYLFVHEDISPEDLKRHPVFGKDFDKIDAAPKRIIKSDTGIILDPYKNRANRGGKDDDTGLLMFRLYHAWDRRNQERFTLLENSDLSWGTYPWPYSHDGFAQTPLIFNEISETEDDAKSYPQGEIFPMIPLLRELNQLRTAMVRHRRRSGTLIIVPQTATEEDIRSLKKGEDVAIVRVSPALLAQIVLHNPPAIAPDVYQVGERILQDLDLVGGFSQVLLGGNIQGEKLATEINYQAQGATARTGEKIDEIESHSVMVAKKLASNAWEFMPREDIRQILGETMLSEEMWPDIQNLSRDERRHIIQNEIETRVSAGSTQPPKDRSLERKSRLDTVNVMGALFPDKLQPENVERFILETFDDKEVDNLLIPQGQVQQAEAQQENQLLEQGIPCLARENDPHELHLSVHGQGAPSPAKDQHIMMHSQKMMAKMPGRSPQEGDTNPQGGAVKPDQLRAGIPSEVDMTGPMTRSVKEEGVEKGGIPSI